MSTAAHPPSASATRRRARFSTGLRHIKNVGERVAAEIVAEREAAGPFVSLFDLCLRVSSRDLNRRVVEALIRSGACDSLGERGAMLAVLDRAIDRAATIRRERESGQTSLFGDTVVLIEPVSQAADDLDGRDVNGPFAIAADERLSWEREFLGMYLSDHPLRRIAGELQQRVDTTINELGAHLDGLIVQVGGAIRDMRTFVPRRSTTGQRMAALQIEDLTGSVEVVVFARVFEECVSALRPDAVIVVRGKVEAGRTVSRRNLDAGARRRTASTSSRRRSSPRRSTRMTIRASPHGDGTAPCTSASAPRRSAFSARSGTRSRSTRAIARWSSTSTRERASTRSRSPSTSPSNRVRRWSEPWKVWSVTTRIASRCVAFARRNGSAPRPGADAARLEAYGKISPKTNLIAMITTMYMTSAAIAGRSTPRGHAAAVQTGEWGDQRVGHGPDHLHHRMPRVGMEHREQDADEHQDRDRDRDVHHHLLDEQSDGLARVDAATEDQCLQDLRDDVDDHEREDRREVDAAEGGKDAAKGREDRDRR